MPMTHDGGTVANAPGGLALEPGMAEGELCHARDAAIVATLAPVSTLRIAGRDAEGFLQGQFTNDVATLGPGGAQYSAYCSPKGRVLSNFVLLRADANEFEILLPLALADGLRKRLSMFILRSQVTATDISGERAWLGLGGPAAAPALAEVMGERPPAALMAVSSTDSVVSLRLPGSRYLVRELDVAPLLRQRLVTAGAHPAGFAAWQWLGIRAGVPIVVPPLQDTFVPQGLNWDVLGGISFRKGCYSGQEIVARMQYLGRLKERTILAHAESGIPSSGVRIFSRVFGDQPCGTVVNAAGAPGGGSDLLVVVQTSAADSDDLRLANPDGARLAQLPLPYAMPAAQAPRPRAL